MTVPQPPADYRLSLANERTFLAWIRTAVVLVAGGVAAAKAIEFNHDIWRWLVAGPPVVAGGVLALHAGARWRGYETTMGQAGQLAVGRGFRTGGIALSVYAAVALVAMVLDG